MKPYHFLSKWKQEYDDLYFKNREQTIEDSITIYRRILCTGELCCAFLVMVSYLADGYDIFRYSYLILGIWMVAFALIIRKSTILKKYPIIFYLYNIITVLQVSYLSAVLTPDYVGIEILLALVFIPIAVPDSYSHIIRFNIFLGVIYLCIVVPNKIPDIKFDEVVNVVDFTFIGIFMGIFIQKLRLKNLELTRCLNIERSTDVLTGLRNRRMLFEYFDYYKVCHDQAIYAIVMIDVDKFKQFNDTYGHVAGDQCLKAVGQQLMAFGKEQDVDF